MGTADGALLGLLVGTLVGTADGALLGLLVGTLVGTTDGALLGLLVGTLVGTADGALVVAVAVVVATERVGAKIDRSLPYVMLPRPDTGSQPGVA